MYLELRLMSRRYPKAYLQCLVSDFAVFSHDLSPILLIWSVRALRTRRIVPLSVEIFRIASLIWITPEYVYVFRAYLRLFTWQCQLFWQILFYHSSGVVGRSHIDSLRQITVHQSTIVLVLDIKGQIYNDKRLFLLGGGLLFQAL